MDHWRVIQCPRCRSGGTVTATSTGASCNACGELYPGVNGVPILLGDPTSHEKDMHDARCVNPQWYVEEQLPEASSPWRHHLRKRRLYVEMVLSRELERLGKPRFTSILDLGCGDGNNLAWLGAFASTLYGSDYNAVRTARAKAQVGDANVFLADVLDYPVVDGAFEVVFFNHVLEHIGDDGRALSTVGRILAPGGLLVLGVPNEGAWWWQLAYRRAPEVLATTDHVHFYTADVVADKVRAAGLAVKEVHHMGWGPPDWELDGKLRRHKVMDDLFELFGKLFLRSQASSLYIVASKMGS